MKNLPLSPFMTVMETLSQNWKETLSQNQLRPSTSLNTKNTQRKSTHSLLPTGNSTRWTMLHHGTIPMPTPHHTTPQNTPHGMTPIGTFSSTISPPRKVLRQIIAPKKRAQIKMLPSHTTTQRPPYLTGPTTNPTFHLA